MSKKAIWEYTAILLGSILYAFGTVAFIFPHALLLGGTSGVSVILNHYLSFSPGMLLVGINTLLLLLAFLVLGKKMAVKTLVGSVLTTAFVGVFEKLMSVSCMVENPYTSALLGAGIITVASGTMFYVDSGSGGTDILALIIRKYTPVSIGKALLLTDILIVLVGGFLSGRTILIGSLVGLLLKTLGIDGVIYLLRRFQNKRKGD